MNKRMLYICIVFFCVFGGNLHAQANTDGTFENYIVTQGFSTISVPVEYVSIQLHITSMEKTPRLAQEANEVIINEVFYLLSNTYTMKKEHYFSENTKLTPRYEYNNQTQDISKRRILIGYEARTQVVIKLYNYNRFSGLILSLLDTSVQEIASINYVVSSDPKYYHEALTKAFEAAKNKAVLLANEIGKQINYRKIQITESPAQLSNPTISVLRATSMESPSANMGIADTREIEAQVSVKFTIE